ncbi:hypothetical protein DWG18_11390 [Lysobacter sp. TY2-98]|uniref:hypothetical protein n=1 Tax=Lysobacter sp. TY2-98 TaxID=2290922 RepID=UPI000E20B805|nr:hypothetical protein [Lysobacter sp. TY2-98]AXK72822.1 hypothetical protein DWG18_11390 [Lysobacter sp. TY2-98]
MGNAYWDRSALDAELQNFSLAAVQHARSPRTDHSDREFQAMFRDAAKDLLAFASPRDRDFVFDALERICRIHPHCNASTIAHLRAAHESMDGMDVPHRQQGGLIDPMVSGPA